MTAGTLFPDIQPAAIRRVTVPVLLLSDAKSYLVVSLDGRPHCCEHFDPSRSLFVARDT